MAEYLKKQQGDLADLGFKTAAQWITETLKEIRKTYVGADKESIKMTKKLNYAIEKLNSKRGLFNIDNSVNFEDAEDEQEPSFMVTPNKPREPRSKQPNSSYRRRHSV
jgi:hypothetical protein